MLQQYGDVCIGERKVYAWVEAFKNGRTSVSNEEHYDHPSMTITDENVGCAGTIMCDSKCISIDFLAK